MTQKDDALYLGHMLEIAHKALSFVAGKEQSDFDSDEVLQIAAAHLLQTIGEAYLGRIPT
jgi:uncharacterized protein with HEPN domain